MNTYDKRYKWGLASEVFFGCRFGKRWSFLCLLKVLLKYLKVSALERTLLFIWPEFPAISVCFSLFETCPLYCPAGEHSSCFENNKLSNGSSSKIRHCSQFLSVDPLKLNEKVEYPKGPVEVFENALYSLPVKRSF